MEEEEINPEKMYAKLVKTWILLFMSSFLVLVVIHLLYTEKFQLDFSKPILGENTVIVCIALVVAIHNFIAAFYRKNQLLKLAVAEQKIEHVETALKISCIFCVSIVFCGLFLFLLESYPYFFIFYLLGTLGFIFHFPRRENVIAAGGKQNSI